ncbi:hypothetical protein [Nonomuraea rhizosphaerae]|uniref:hypothetical protein n=1 Tax=Nonomuraea rhizosphaerae TaxID=2665663 RepID=UPI001C5DCFD9|nr:hypothetical protein [Nonomuraea rhizosphaerae]
MRTRQIGMSLVMATVLAGAVGAAAAGPASASGTGTAGSTSTAGCSGAGPTRTDVSGRVRATTWCHNYRTGDVYAGRAAGRVTGVLYAGRNWFACQMKGAENPAVGGARNNWWLRTQGDKGYADAGWGWFPATYVSGGGNYQTIPGLPVCPEAKGPQPV